MDYFSVKAMKVNSASMITLLVAAVFMIIVSINSLSASESDYILDKGSKSLSIFGFSLPVTHPMDEDREHFVEMLESPNNNHVLILSYLHLKGEYDAWLCDRSKGSRPVKIHAEHKGRHPVLEWHGDEVFSIGWRGMGYHVSGVYHISNVVNPTMIDDPVIIDSDRKIYVSYLSDISKTALVVAYLFDDKSDKEVIDIDLAESLSVIDRYESISDIQVIGKSINLSITTNGVTVQKFVYPEILRK